MHLDLTDAQAASLLKALNQIEDEWSEVQEHLEKRADIDPNMPADDKAFLPELGQMLIDIGVVIARLVATLEIVEGHQLPDTIDKMFPGEK
jgi:Mg2+ and Co2+ transporter CorA